jgi:hypothetical protein
VAYATHENKKRRRCEDPDNAWCCGWQSSAKARPKLGNVDLLEGAVERGCVTQAEFAVAGCFKERGSTGSSPMTATATPVSAAAEQDHQHNDNQDQFHGISPLMATALCAACQAFNGVFERLFLTGVHPPLALPGHEQIRSVATQFKRDPFDNGTSLRAGR